MKLPPRFESKLAPRMLMVLMTLLVVPDIDAGVVRYTAVDLGTLRGSSSFATAINDSGIVVGYSSSGPSFVVRDSGPYAGSWHAGRKRQCPQCQEQCN